MFYIAVEIWIAGLIILLLGFVLTSTEQERKAVQTWKMAIAYFFWPVSLFAVLLNALRKPKSSD
jgi:hypothetical protein